MRAAYIFHLLIHIILQARTLETDKHVVHKYTHTHTHTHTHTILRLKKDNLSTANGVSKIPASITWV
jgi:hypothetical protein